MILVLTVFLWKLPRSINILASCLVEVIRFTLAMKKHIAMQASKAVFSLL